MAFRIESPDGLDLVIEQIDSQRSGRTHRVDIEQRATDRELARADDLADARITRFGKSLSERLDREGVADGELERTSLHVGPGQQALHERVGSDDETAMLSAWQLEQRSQPLGNDVGMRREQVIRQHLPIGESQQRQGFAGKKFKFRRETLELAGRVDDHHIEAAIASRGFGERQGGSTTV